MINKIKRQLWLNVKNMPGWSTNRKILVIEADDYGSVRMPSVEVYEKLIFQKIIKENHHDKYDFIETYEDLEFLFEVLKSHRDNNGNPAKITPFFIPTNPDFVAIRNGDFNEYKYKNYNDTLVEYGISKKIHNLWKEGVSEGFFKPQYHGREHVNVPILMRLLQAGNKTLHDCFDLNYCFPPIDNLPNLKSIRPAFYFDNYKDVSILRDSLIDGVKHFNNYFGYNPSVFCPSNGIFHDLFKKNLIDININTIVESGLRFIPDGNGSLKIKRKFIFGKYNKNTRMLNYSRNVVFEPTRDGINQSVEKAINEISAAFRWGKPAVIATHRINFSGGLVKENREKSLESLNKLLKIIIQTWPEVEFFNSEELSTMIHKSFIPKN